MLHGLGGTKASFLPTVAALAPSFRTIAVDMLGFGDSDKPLGASYSPAFQARAIASCWTRSSCERAHFVGHSMGGRVALELGFNHPERDGGLVLMTPAMAWLRERRWAPYLRWVRPELGLFQIAPRPRRRGVHAVGDPGRRHALGPRRRSTSSSASTRPRAGAPPSTPPPGTSISTSRTATTASGRSSRRSRPSRSSYGGARTRSSRSSFMKHVEHALPAARHVELDCGHLPQIERPRETHAAIEKFLRTQAA